MGSIDTLQFAANLGWMFRQIPFLERFDAAARTGFHAVEMPFPYGYSVETLQEMLRQYQLQPVLLNFPAGNWTDGERGLACLPGRQRDFRASIQLGLCYAKQLGVRHIHLMAGIQPKSGFGTARKTFLNNLKYAAEQAKSAGITVLVEALNARDFPGYLVNHFDLARDLCLATGADNVGLLLDCYHLQIIQGDLVANLSKYLPFTKHVQIAGVPQRSEPDEGEIDYPHLLRVLAGLGYRGWVGCEYNSRPLAAGESGWLHRAGFL
jgi:hydroxypyruvate isomerase